MLKDKAAQSKNTKSKCKLEFEPTFNILIIALLAYSNNYPQAKALANFALANFLTKNNAI
jgi:hypothetical protein